MRTNILKTSDVIGIPRQFNLDAHLNKVKYLRVAMAFANKKGFEKLLGHLSNNHTLKIEFLVGTDFCLTEPWVLRRLHDLPFVNGRIVKVRGSTFHPKTIIAEGPGYKFALVGSGNLTMGGLRNNVECFIYTEDQKCILALDSWFKALWDGEQKDVEVFPIKSDFIAKYEKLWKSSSSARKKLEAEGKKSVNQLKDIDKEGKFRWRVMVNQARSSKKWINKRHKEWKEMAREIRYELAYPKIKSITKENWDNFYKIWGLGRLVPIYKNAIWRRSPKLIKGLLHLINENVPVSARLDDLRSSQEYVIKGWGINGMTKILTVHKPKLYPTWNEPVRRALSKFGYEPPGQASEGQKYEEFVQLMRKFISESGLPDMLALDIFLYYKANPDLDPYDG